ncbi:ATP-binding protein [Thiocapsa sp. UBA6158]|jgi:signal transduction histidine kinase|uniref:ATP-binding protein n=1 Tax=Thiocapsa sp. UBA6158 TaxID=1947692 RepID=UPI0025DA9F5E|nr:ATP-binding protein [Thiocapsa sp. UBA6158]
MMAMFNITYVGAFAMARCVAAPIDLSNKPRRRLEAIVGQHSAPQSLVMRARIILLGAADPLLLTTILANLLDNACKYGLPPEPIQLSLTRQGADLFFGKTVDAEELAMAAENPDSRPSGDRARRPRPTSFSRPRNIG